MFLSEETVNNVWNRINSSITQTFPIQSDTIDALALDPVLVSDGKEYEKKDFIEKSWGWARANYSKLTVPALNDIVTTLGIPEELRFDKMDEASFTAWFSGASGPGQEAFWYTLNQNPGKKWTQTGGLTEKEKLFITIDDFISKKDNSVIGSVMTSMAPFAYFDNDISTRLGQSFPKGGTVFLNVLNRSKMHPTVFEANFGPPTYGKTILIEKIFFDVSILETAFESIKEGDVTLQAADIDTAMVNKLIDKMKSQKFGFAGFNIYSEVEPKAFVEWADAEIDTGLITDPFTVPDIKYVRSRLVQTGAGGLSLEDIEAELTNKDFGYTINQCVLSSQLYELGDWRKKIRGEKWQTGKAGAPYGGRIYCVDTKNPNVMMNWLVQPRGMNDLVTKTSYTDWTKKYGYSFQLFKIEEDDKGSSKKYEYKFETSEGTTTLNDIRLKSRDFENNKDDLSSKVFGAPANSVGAEKILIENVEISIAGETIATVKSNIDIKIKFKLDSIEAINAVFEADSGYKDSSGNPEKYKFSLLEVLTQQIGREYAGTQASRALKTAYVPTKNRLMMQITPYRNERTDADTYFDSGPMMFDLSLLKYSMDKDAVSQKVDLTVEFKGYIKSFLNSPMCDVLYDDATKLKLLAQEKATIEQLESKAEFCDIKNLRVKLTEHFQNMKKIKAAAPSNDFILKGLVKRGMMFKLKVDGLEGALRGNIDPDTKQIINPQLLSKTYTTDSIQQITEPTAVSSTAQRASLDVSQDLTFFYFGDLIDVLMDRIYGEAKIDDASGAEPVYVAVNSTSDIVASWKPRSRDVMFDSNGAITRATSSSGTGSAPPDEIDQKFANFPLKVVMPSFKPLYPNPKNDGTYIEHPDNKISIADIPISLSFFQQWFTKDIIDKKVKTYPLGGIINNLLNALVNNVLADMCYRSSSIDRKYFSVVTDFGVFNKEVNKNTTFKRQNKTQFDVIRKQRKLGYDGLIRMQSTDAPAIKKSASIERTDHCNFIIIAELINSFATFENLDLGTNKKKIFDENYIIPLKTNRIIKKSNRSFKRSGFVRSISFSKTDLPYGEEIRFSKDGLNELHMLSAVHDATIETLPMFHLFPGQLCWVDAGFLEGTEIYGSIPWVVGMGGFHVVISVKHSFDVAIGKILKKARTTIEAKFVSSGATEASTAKYAATCIDSATNP